MSLQQRVLWIFFFQPIAFAAWLPRIPEIQDRLGLDALGLSIALLGAPAGILTTILFAGRLTSIWGARRVLMVFYPVCLLSMLPPLLAPNLIWITIALFAAGASIAMLEVGMNVTADSVERKGTKMIMSKAHGFWSLGLMLGSLLGTAAAAIQMAPIAAGMIITALVLPPAMIIAYKFPRDVPDPKKNQLPKKHFSLPHPVLLGVCFFALGATLAEGAVADWGAVFLRDVFAAGPGLSGIGISIFALTLALTRLGGDYLKARFGAAPLARMLIIIALFGVALVFFAPSLPIAVFGFALIGIGVSLAYPLAVSAAAVAPGPSPAHNLAILSFIALFGFLIGPVLIGSITQFSSIRYGLLVLVPMLALSVALAPLLRPAKS